MKRELIVQLIQTYGALKPEGATLLTVPLGETWKILEVKPGPAFGEMRIVAEVIAKPEKLYRCSWCGKTRTLPGEADIDNIWSCPQTRRAVGTATCTSSRSRRADR